jgi:transposase InsO family protein
MGIRDKPTAPASPWQNGCAERLIGSIRRECVDHFIVLGEAHLRHTLRTYACYYNHIRTHWSFAPFNGIYQFTRDPCWTSSPLRSGLGFRHTQPADYPIYWTKADNGGFWPAEVCPLMTQSGHSI